jgi:hypothetical protein
MAIVYDLLFLFFTFVVWPFAVVFGWVRWVHSVRQRSLLPKLSLASHSFATLSLLVGLAGVLFADSTQGFNFWDPSLLKIYRAGFALSVGGLVLAAIGATRTNPLRWSAPLAAIACTLFWISSISTE